MLFKNLINAAALLLASTPLITASLGSRFHLDSKLEKRWQQKAKRTFFPKPATGLESFTTPTGVQIRYKKPGEQGVCETTPGVESYSGYIDLAPNVHVFFWFFESRQNPAEDPLTLWLNGGPGSDSLIGLFQELGPCRITPELESVINPYSWNNVSNMLFLSQPVGTGFSYQHIANGSLGYFTGTFLNSSQAKPTGTYPILDPVDVGTIDTTDLAAIAAWHIIQGFLSGLPKLDANINKKKEFNLWTESYGGHYGPAFFNYFYEQNAAIQNGSMKGYPTNFNTLGIGNGIIDEYVQAPMYPEFAMNNTYGIKAYNDTVYNYAKFATYMYDGCLAQIDSCKAAATAAEGWYIKEAHGHVITPYAIANPSMDSLCQEAADMCRDNVESPYYYYSGRGVYDIRHTYNDPTPPTYFVNYLNQAYVQNAIGVSVNYTDANNDIYWQFQHTGDFIYPNFLADLENILASGVRVSLYYGDADYICNWFGGEAISLALKYSNKKEFAAAGYQAMVAGGVEYGEVREYGNFSFTRIYEAGHEVPYYQPEGALAVFNRSINNFNIADGTEKVTGDLGSNGPSSPTHTETSVALFTGTGSAFSAYSSSLISSYGSKDNAPPPSVTGGYRIKARATMV